MLPACVMSHRNYGRSPPTSNWENGNWEKVDALAFWFSQPIDIRRECCDNIKICVLLPVLNNCNAPVNPSAPWLTECTDMCLMELDFIEMLEDLLDVVKPLADNRSFLEGLFRIGTKMRKETPKIKNDSISEALCWVRSTGVTAVCKKLEALDTVGFGPLQLFFIQYTSYITQMAEKRTTTFLPHSAHCCETNELEAESLKQQGNEEFAKGNFSIAADHYSRAIHYSPDNHLLFGNRALCFIRMGRYMHALSDGKKATVLKCNWPKGHYRFCETLYLMGQHERALESNEKAQQLCKDSPKGIKDLLQQHEKFKNKIKENQDKQHKKFTNKKKSREKKLSAQLASALSQKEKKNISSSGEEDVHLKDHVDGTNVEDKAGISVETTAKTHKKGKAKRKSREADKSRGGNVKPDVKESQKDLSCSSVPMNVSTLSETMKTLVHDGCIAMNEQRFRSALLCFSQLMEILEPPNLQRLYLSNIDFVVLLYGHANALLGIGQCEELAKAENQFKRIITDFSKERFNCLALFGIGNIYFRQNRFSDALSQYVKSQTMVKHRIMPGVLTWPTTSFIIEETRPEKLQLVLENRIQECKFPPKPDAICRYDQCPSLSKTQIYFTDPDFKGFIRVTCCQLCIIEFHVCCWKKLKASSYNDKSEKDFLKNTCLTPDCQGRITHVVIFDSSGLVKREFEDRTIKKKIHKPMVKQKDSSKKMRTKWENKAERRKRSQEENTCLESCEKQKNQLEKNSTNQADLNSEDTSSVRTSEVMMYHIQSNEDLIKFGVPDTKPFCDLLVSWGIMSQDELDAFSFETSCSCPFEEMALVLNHLYKIDNYIKSRIFLYLLLKCGEMLTLELLDWLFSMDEIGLDAANQFREQYMDLILTIKFEKIVDLWNVTYGRNLDYIVPQSKVPEIAEMLDEADPETFRCFIWFIEEHREHIFPVNLDVELHYYFLEMDTPVSLIPVMKFLNEGQSGRCIKVKNKHKKKKQKQPKTVYRLSNGLSTRSPDDDIFTEENTLSLLDPYEPFTVPEYLQHEVEEFETGFQPTPTRHNFQWQLDNNAVAIRDTLYEYFFQILDEHGPLEINDEILIREYKDFPEDTHKLVEEAGGLKDFLLESPRFVMMDNLLGLKTHALILEELAEKPKLNPTAREFRPSSNKPVSPPIRENAGICYGMNRVGQFPHNPIHILPNQSPVFNGNITSHFLFSANQPVYSLNPGLLPISVAPTLIPDPGISLQPAIAVDRFSKYNVGISNYESLVDDAQYTEQEELYSETSSMYSDDILETDETPASPVKKGVQKAIVAVQVAFDFTESEVNTDPYYPFETQQGDILRMEKEQVVLQDQLKEATEKYENLQIRCQEEITSLDKQIKDAIEKKKITKKELAWLNQFLENDSKKWQQEKKEINEKLKALKNNVKLVNEVNEKYTRDIEEKKKQYESYMDGFLRIGFSFENKKAKVEERTKKTREILQEIQERAMAAEVSILENRKQTELLKLRSMASKAEHSIDVLKAMASGNSKSGQPLQHIRNMESSLLVLKAETERLKSQFDENINLVKNGAKLSALVEIKAASFKTLSNVPVHHLQLKPNDFTSKTSTSEHSSAPSACSNPPPPAKSPANKSVRSKVSTSSDIKKNLGPSAPVNNMKMPAATAGKAQGATENQNSKVRHPSPVKPTMFDKIIDELHDIFPHYESLELANFIKDLRSRSGGTLNGMKHDDIVSRVTEHILDHQSNFQSESSERQNTGNGNASRSGLSPSLPQSKQPWRVVTGPSKSRWQMPDDSESYNDDPCIICHDELRLYPVHKLDCGHRFHKQCIKTWLNTQSTCPTCRDHALLPEDFPALSGRMRMA